MRGVGRLRHELRRLDARRRLGRLLYRGDGAYCPCCQSTFRRLRAYNGPNRLCWRCGSLERHRAIWLYLEARPEMLAPASIVLHIAPEPALRPLFERIRDVDYRGGDLLGEFGNLRLDVTELSFPDATFDVVVCNHVLEHVPDDRRAMSELRRVLKPGGWALLQVPDVDSPVTDEDPACTDPQARLARFGQRDHVRRYGWDYVQRLGKAGFDVKVEKPEDVFPRDVVERCRLRKYGEVEPLFIGS
jgi:SAM-dependent methyltransferase